jgi:bis(5'-nucleosyl)-tetraphosphatase (symmetrical)
MLRRIFIGDIQGCRDELERLLEAVNFDPTADELHPVGDLVNRGPDSLGVLKLLKSLDAGGVLGNHDLHLLRLAAGTRDPQPGDTLDAILVDDRREELLDWLAARPLIRAWDDLLLVHAALSPAWSDPVATLEGLDPLRSHPDTAFATLVRYCDSEGNRPSSDWPPPPGPFRPWYDLWRENGNEARTVVFGHWARRGLVHLESLRGIDTGCVWGKCLTAWIAEEDRFVQVYSTRAYGGAKG